MADPTGTARHIGLASTPVIGLKGAARAATSTEGQSGLEGNQDLILPLVSVVLVNFNYARFIDRAVQSIRAQTYPRIETVIVDDCSTDGSRAILQALARCREDDTKVLLRDENGGQTSCCARGVAETSGSYVIFMDADDLLLPQAVETHVYTHLSTRVPVAFTTVDILNNFGGDDVNTSSRGFAEYVASGTGRAPSRIRPIDEAAPNSWFGAREPAVPPDRLHFVMPPHADPWVWSPTSANCFRRDAIEPLLRGADIRSIRWGTDGYLVRPLSALYGSLLIDRPLMRYVIHNANCFTTGPPLHRTKSFDVRSKKGDLAAMLKVAVGKLMEGAATDAARYEHADHFFDAMRALCGAWPGLDRAGEEGAYYQSELMRHRAALLQGFGPDAFADEMAKSRVIRRRSRFRLPRWVAGRIS